ncbi:MAG: RNA 2',3'-cyclic phosphodiesterase, partial [bacterium]
IAEAVRQEIVRVQEELIKAKERISWTRPENIHLTLKFLGEVEEHKITPIAAVIESVAKEMHPFAFIVKDLGAFPNFRRARILWVGVENATEECAQISQNLETGLSNLGFRKEGRKFSPHLTIARVKAPLSKQFIDRIQNYDFEGGATQVKEIILMKSDLRPTGAIYMPLKKIKLKSKLV